jgi:hypothetical protein
MNGMKRKISLMVTNYFRKKFRDKINFRQSIVSKNTFGLSKYSRPSLLLNSFKIKSINQ